MSNKKLSVNQVLPVFVHGAHDPARGVSVAGWKLEVPGLVLPACSQGLQHETVQSAHALAVKNALQDAAEYPLSAVRVSSINQSLVFQLSRKWKVGNEHLASIYEEVWATASRHWKKVEYLYVTSASEGLIGAKQATRRYLDSLPPGAVAS